LEYLEIYIHKDRVCEYLIYVDELWEKHKKNEVTKNEVNELTEGFLKEFSTPEKLAILAVEKLDLDLWRQINIFRKNKVPLKEIAELFLDKIFYEYGSTTKIVISHLSKFSKIRLSLFREAMYFHDRLGFFEFKEKATVKKFLEIMSDYMYASLYEHGIDLPGVIRSTAYAKMDQKEQVLWNVEGTQKKKLLNI